MAPPKIQTSMALFVLIAFLWSASCTSQKVHPIHMALPQEKVKGIKVGDTVEITTYSGDHYRFKVENISREAIEGEGNQIQLTEIETVKKVHLTAKRVASAIGIIALLVLLVWLGSNSESNGEGRIAAGSSAR